MQPVVTGTKQLNIVLQVNIHLARLTVLLRLVNIGTGLVMFLMFFTEDALIVQVRLHISSTYHLVVTLGFTHVSQVRLFSGVAFYGRWWVFLFEKLKLVLFIIMD